MHLHGNDPVAAIRIALGVVRGANPLAYCNILVFRSTLGRRNNWGVGRHFEGMAIVRNSRPFAASVRRDDGNTR